MGCAATACLLPYPPKSTLQFNLTFGARAGHIVLQMETITGCSADLRPSREYSTTNRQPLAIRDVHFCAVFRSVYSSLLARVSVQYLLTLSFYCRDSWSHAISKISLAVQLYAQ